MEGLKIFKKFSNSLKIQQKLPEDREIDFENPQKYGFGKRMMFLSNKFDKIDFLKPEDRSNKIENSILLSDILGIFVPLETQKLIIKMSQNQNNWKNNENSIEKIPRHGFNEFLKIKYQIFLILKKNERLEIVSDSLNVTEKLIKAMNEIVNNKKFAKIRNKLQCFCIFD